MGISQSKTTVQALQESYNTSTTTAFIQSNQYCDQGLTATKNLSIDVVDGVDGFTVEQNSEQVSDLTCAIVATNTVDIKNKMTAALSTNIKATAAANPAILGINNAESYVNSKQLLVNAVVNSIDIEQLQRCATAQLTDQNITIGQLLNSKNVKFIMKSTQNVLTKCSSSQSNFVTTTADLASSISADVAASSTSGIDFSAIFILLIIVVAVILLFPSLLGGLLNTGVSAVKGVGSLGVSAAKGVGSLGIDAVKGTAGLAGTGITALSGVGRTAPEMAQVSRLTVT